MKRLLLLFVLLPLTPCFAHASCGDWLAQHEMTPADADGKLVPENQVADANKLAGSTEPMPIRRVPCNGPGCRQAPAAPVPAPSPVSIQSDWKWVACNARSGVSQSDSLLHHFEELSLSLCDGFLRAIDRPPKS